MQKGKSMGQAASFIRRAIARFRRTNDEFFVEGQKEEEEGNPYLPQIREIMEQVLKEKGIAYEQFAPVIIDGNDPDHALMAAERLAGDLNSLVLLTDQPEYFEEFAENIYEEQGLITQIFPKASETCAQLYLDGARCNVILDFEDPGEEGHVPEFGKKIYIPIFKRRWESAANLDIAVPIGYNTMIVKGSERAEKWRRLDKFEQAFYNNE